MENTGSGLLELPLESGEMLAEVSLSTDSVVTVTNESVNNVGEMLEDESTQAGISGMEPSSIDFEFANTDLGNGTEFSMDNAGVFGITDNDIDAREGCEYLFRDSSCFDETVNKQIDACAQQQNGFVTVPSSGKTNLYKDLGLKLQVIPLNNLQYVSTIQTSKGLHILAIPSLTSPPSVCTDVSVQQFDEKTKQYSDTNTNLNVEKGQQNQQEILNSETASPNAVVKSRTPLKGSSLSKSTKHSRKIKESVDRHLIVYRNDNFKKGTGSSVKRRKQKPLCLEVTKPDNSRKQRMVSLLNTSVTNRLKQAQQSAKLRRNDKEIKVTFHLKPLSTSRKTVLEKVNTVFNERTTFDGKAMLKTNELKRSFTKEDFDTCEAFNVIPTEDKIPVLEVNETSKSFLRGNEHTKQVLEENEHLKSVLEGNEHTKTGFEGNKHTNSISEGNDCTKLDETHSKTFEIDSTVELSKAASAGYQCKHCLTTFIREGHLKNHLNTHKDILILDKNSTVIINPREDKYEQQLKPENKNHAVNLTESEDVPETNTLSSLISSENNNNSGQESRILTCEFCGMKFKTQGNLTRHKLTHSVSADTKIKGRYQCDDCNKSFMQRCDLKRHVIIHSGTYPHTCSVCQKGFIRKSDLTVHEKFHTQEKRYRCNLCSKAYFQTGDLSRHMRQNHSELCQFACQDCGRKYTTQKTLNLHKKTKH